MLVSLAWPRPMLSPGFSSRSVIFSPLTNVPNLDSQSRSRMRAVLHQELGVQARDVGAGQPHIAFAAAAEGGDGAFDGNGAAAERVGDDQARRDVSRHGWRDYIILRMKFRQLADTGVFVSELCLGAMTFGGRGQMWEVIGGLDQSAVDAIVHRALDAGINFIDTADVYSAGESETLLGKALGGAAPRRRAGDQGARTDGQRRRTRSACRACTSCEAVEASLSGSAPTTSTCIRSTASIRSRTSKTRCGRSTIWCAPARSATSAARTCAAWQLMKALAISREQQLERFRCTQSYYSLAGRELEREMIPLLKDQGLGLLVWSPLAGGFLSGKFTRNGGDEAARRATFDFPPVDKETGFDILDVLDDGRRRARRERRADRAGLDPRAADA